MLITPTLKGGGAEKIVSNLSLELNKKSNLYILTYSKKSGEYDFAGKRINIDSFGKNFFQKIFCAVNRIIKCRNLVKKNNIDCIISFLPQTDYVNVFSKNKKCKSIITIVSNMSVVYPKGIKKWFRSLVIRRADFVVGVAKGVLDDIIENFGCDANKSKVIYNSCDIKGTQQICELDAEYKRYMDLLPEKYIISMGSFRHPKGHWHLIKAFASVKDRLPDVSLVILGEGDYREKYNEIINALGLQNRVFMPGFINPPFSIIAHAELFVFSSVFEGFGNALIEAMACNVPVLSTDCNYGPREIIAPGTNLNNKAEGLEKGEYGCLLPDFGQSPIDVSADISENEKLMGYAITELLNDNDLRAQYVKKASAYIKKFDNTLFADNWLNLISDVIGDKNE